MDEKSNEDLMAERFVDLAIRSQRKLDELQGNEELKSVYNYHQGYRNAMIRAAGLLSGWDSWIHERMREAKKPDDPFKLQLREGVEYVSRDGRYTTRVIPESKAGEFYQWAGIRGGYVYSDNGRLFESHESPFDLIAEVPPPEPEPFKAGDWVVADSACSRAHCGESARQVTQATKWTIYVGDSHRFHQSHFRRAKPAEIAKATEYQPDDDGWIEWNGGECPVDGEQRVHVQFRDENKRSLSIDPAKAERLRWSHIGSDGDIVAYRLVKSVQKGANRE